jgi:signal transduction histidine kinase
VTVEVSGADQQVTLSVSNAGAAIPQSDMPQLFQAFRPGSGTNGGIGLGLYIVAEIVRAHGGSIEVRSTGTGTRFVSTWPISAG